MGKSTLAGASYNPGIQPRQALQLCGAPCITCCTAYAAALQSQPCLRCAGFHLLTDGLQLFLPILRQRVLPCLPLWCNFWSLPRR